MKARGFIEPPPRSRRTVTPELLRRRFPEAKERTDAELQRMCDRAYDIGAVIAQAASVERYLERRRN